MRRLIEVARERGLATMIGHIIANNTSMHKLCAGLGFTIEHTPDDAGSRTATLALAAA